MNATLVVLGASSDQLFLIRTAREMGLFVLALDRNPSSPGFADADAHLVVSTRDVPAVQAELSRWDGPPIAGITTMGSDIPEIVSELARWAGTPHLSAETARLATDKLAMKRRFREAGIPTAWFQEVDDAHQVRSLLAEHGELVLKPIDRSGSRGVFRLDAGSDVEELFARAREFSFSGRVQVEEFLRGPQISTESLLWNGQAFTPGFADRNYELLERFRPQIMENGGWVPSALDDDERAEVSRVAEEAARALGIEHGVAKGDLVLTEDGPKVIEVAARLSGGDFCAGLVPLGTGVNYVRTAIQLAIGETPDASDLEPRFHRAVANRYLFPEAGRLLRVEGVEEVRAQEWIEKLELWYEPGAEVPPTLSHAHRFGVFVATGEDRAIVEERVAWVYRTLRVVVESTDAMAA